MKKTVLNIFAISIILLTLTGCGEKKYEHSFNAIVIEASSSYILVEPTEEEDERKASDKFYVELKNNNITYEIGDDVKITYEGNIGDDYPTKINIKEIELTPTNNFKLTFYPESKSKKQILNKDENSKYNYNIYIYGGDAEITINKKIYSLEQSLKENRINMDNILEHAKQTCSNIRYANDGGSIEFHFDDYTIIKLNKATGENDVYFGDKSLVINDLE